jgi:hypothetical protein
VSDKPKQAYTFTSSHDPILNFTCSNQIIIENGGLDDMAFSVMFDSLMVRDCKRKYLRRDFSIRTSHLYRNREHVNIYNEQLVK